MTHINDDMNNKKFKNKAKGAFEKQVDSLNMQTQQRLKMARKAALTQETNNTSFFNNLDLKWITGAGLALASILGFLIVPSLMTENNGVSNNELSNIAFIEDIELLSQESVLELYTQLAFYEWLDESFNEAEL